MLFYLISHKNISTAVKRELEIDIFQSVNVLGKRIFEKCLVIVSKQLS